MSEENPLLTLPKPVVDALFKSAELEASRIRRRILNLYQRVERLKAAFRFHRFSQGEPGRIVAVDGSMSVAPSERIGSSFAIYAAGYMVFDGGRLIDEKYYAGSLSWVEGGLRSFSTLLRLLMAHAERTAALEAYQKHNPDLVLLDGPFFYFRGHCRFVKAVPLEADGFRSGLDLIRRVRDMTLTLMGTGRAVGVIRRSKTRAIDGWIIYHQGEEACLKASDKHILTMIMPPMSFWSYREALGENAMLYGNFYRFYRRRRQKGEPADRLLQQRNRLLEQARKDLENKFRNDLDLEFGRLPVLERYYVRYAGAAPPFEVETVEGFDVEGFAERFAGFYNPSTGLPYPVDLMDAAVSLPKGSTTAFTNEVEARLIRDSSLPDKAAISDYFTVLNPQKEEYI